jgi:hypothetical protein
MPQRFVRIEKSPTARLVRVQASRAMADTTPHSITPWEMA